jgi:hypothetical protein
MLNAECEVQNPRGWIVIKVSRMGWNVIEDGVSRDVCRAIVNVIFDSSSLDIFNTRLTRRISLHLGRRSFNIYANNLGPGKKI